MRVNKYDVDEKNTKFSFKNFARALKYLKRYRKKLFVALVANLTSTLLSLVYAKIIQFGIDEVIVSGEFSNLLKMCAVSVLVQVVVVLMIKIKSKVLVKVNQNIVEDLKNDLFSHLQYLSSEYFDTRPHGKILVRLTDYAETVSTLITNKLIDTILQLISLVLTLIFMFITNVELTFITIVGVIILSLIFNFTMKKKRIFRLTQNNKRSNMNAYVLESLKGTDTTKVFNRQSENEKIHNKLTADFFESFISFLWYGNITWSSTSIISNLSKVLIYTIGIFFLFPGISLGTIVAMGSYSSKFWNPIRNLFVTMDDFIESMTYLERILETIDEPITIKNTDKPIKKKTNGDIKFKDVIFSYNAEKLVLDKVSFEIKPGQKIAIVGETGSGKTTIANLMARFYDINSGKILIDGIDIKAYDLNTLRRQISIMQQDNYLFTDTIMNNLKYGNSKMTDEDVIKLCKKLGLHDWINEEFDQGYYTILENHGNTLSDGQKQLISYIRILLNNPKILVLDEATSKIDVKTENIIQDKINNLLKNKTTITIAHRLSTIVNSDVIMLIKDKRVYEIGNHEELMKKKGEYYKLFSSQDNLI